MQYEDSRIPKFTFSFINTHGPTSAFSSQYIAVVLMRVRTATLEIIKTSRSLLWCYNRVIHTRSHSPIKNLRSDSGVIDRSVVLFFVKHRGDRIITSTKMSVNRVDKAVVFNNAHVNLCVWVGVLHHNRFHNEQSGAWELSKDNEARAHAHTHTRTQSYNTSHKHTYT